ncbi:hypothetical protein RFX61_09220, partial [Acinetobacter baumannii]|nr:hypothetical protein [Acinetobacter baumannii]
GLPWEARFPFALPLHAAVKQIDRRNTMYSRVYVEITNQCNRNCSFCPGTSRQPGMMTMDAFGQVLQKLQGITQML